MTNQLKEQIILKVGKEITTRGDCEYLSGLIEEETGEYLNYNTLRRFFDVDKQKFSPRKSTLDILSKYVGFHTFEHFSAFNPQKVAFDNHLQMYEAFAKLDPIKLSYQFESLGKNARITYIIQLCRFSLISKQIPQLCSSIKSLELSDDTFTYDEKVVIGNSVGLLLRSVKLAERDWLILSADYFFNKYVFEVFVDYSALNGYYKTFVKLAPHDEHQKLFKYCLTNLHHYLNLNKEWKPVDTAAALEMQNEIHPILLGRILSHTLYKNESTLSNFEMLKTVTIEYLYEPIVASIITSNFELFEFIRTKMFSNVKSNKYTHLHYRQVYQLMKTCFLYKSKKNGSASKALKEVVIKDFRLSYKELLSFFYYILDYKLNNSETSREKAVKLSGDFEYKRFDVVFIEHY